MSSMMDKTPSTQPSARSGETPDFFPKPTSAKVSTQPKSPAPATAQDHPHESAKVEDTLRRYVVMGLVIITLCFGVIGVWAATAPLSSAVVAPGMLVVESSRKALQHLEGGIIKDILVRDGDTVAAGQVVLRLDQTRARASADTVANQYRSHQALEARLVAERDGRDEVVFPHDLLNAAKTNPVVAQAVDGQRRQFAERRRSLEGQVAILESRIAQSRQEIRGLNHQKAAEEKQISILQDQLVGLRELFEKGWYQKSKILAMERDSARLEGRDAEHDSAIARAQKNIGEAKLQIAQVRQRVREDVIEQLRTAQAKSSDLSERFTVTSDVLERTLIRAPQAGVVQNLAVHTSGGVIRPGETLMEIVPDQDSLVIEARISPLDVDNVHPGLEAEVRFPAFRVRNLPVILGTVKTVSADRLTDKRTNMPYFSSRVEIPANELKKLGDHKPHAGMSTEVLIQTGERTVMDYFLKPLEDAMTRALVEG